LEYLLIVSWGRKGAKRPGREKYLEPGSLRNGLLWYFIGERINETEEGEESYWGGIKGMTKQIILSMHAES